MTAPTRRPDNEAALLERNRLGQALVDVVVARGYENTTLEEVLAHAKVTQTGFDRHFENLEDAVVKVYVLQAGEFNRMVDDAYAAEATWRDGMRAAGTVAAGYVRDNPRRSLFGTVQFSPQDSSPKLIARTILSI